MIVKLRFDEFQLKPVTICEDYVEILDGNSSFSKSKGKFCSNIRPPDRPNDIRSSGRYMWVRFRAGYELYGRYGVFKATFTAENKPSSVQTSTPMTKFNSSSGKHTSLVSRRLVIATAKDISLDGLFSLSSKSTYRSSTICNY